MRRGLFLLAIAFTFFSQAQTSPFLDSLLKSTLTTYSNVLSQPTKYKLQVVYTQINRDENNNPTFKEFKFHPYKDYFYPASVVKLPVSLAAILKLQDLKERGVGLETSMITDSAFFCQRKINSDTSTASDFPTVGNYIKKMLLVSDNYACARTYEFVGCDYLHKKLEDIGYGNVRITNRLDGSCPGDTAKITPPIYFLGEKNDTIYKQPLTFSEYKKTHPIENSKVGKQYVDVEGIRQPGPKDFSKHNYLLLSDLHDMMRRIIFNNHLKGDDKLPLSEENWKFMVRQLGMLPKESEYPKYPKKVYYDSYKKYFMYGSSVATIKGDSVRIFNIVGRAYGFLIDCAYIVDFKNKVEFLLSSSIYVNERDIVGGGKYEYELLGLPFLRDLSKTIYNYERNRTKKHLPNLDEFNLFGYR
ncbi:MAG: serine hydrolase [Bacteroidia bacterium]|nr:serine hydrolase [Bacteroidia bacterium]